MQDLYATKMSFVGLFCSTNSSHHKLFHGKINDVLPDKKKNIGHFILIS